MQYNVPKKKKMMKKKNNLFQKSSGSRTFTAAFTELIWNKLLTFVWQLLLIGKSLIVSYLCSSTFIEDMLRYMRDENAKVT